MSGLALRTARIIDEKSTGLLTPAEVLVDEGQHAVTLRKPGFDDADISARVSPGQRFSVAPKLQARAPENPGRLKRLLGAKTASEAAGELVVRTRPKGAEVLINGFALTRRTPLRVPLRAGKYDLILRLDDHKTLKRKIEIAHRQILELDEPLDQQ